MSLAARPAPCRSQAGSFLLICLALVAAMVAVAFAFVNSMRTAVELGPTSIPGQLSREAARAGIAHATEVMVRDYLERPLAPTSDASPHRVLFAPIDNINATNPHNPDPSTSNLYVYNDNDLLPGSKILHPYMTMYSVSQGDPIVGRIYKEHPFWVQYLLSNPCPRYIEPGYWGLDQSKESSPTTANRLDFTKAPSTTPAVNRPLYFDSAWREVATRDKARYRLRYAVMCEDLSGHLLSTLSAPFLNRGAAIADGTLPLADRGQGIEFDMAWTKKYAPSVGGFQIFNNCTLNPRNNTALWLGHIGHPSGTMGDMRNMGSYSNLGSMGFFDNGTDPPMVQGASAWFWDASYIKNTVTGLTGGDSPRVIARTSPYETASGVRAYPGKPYTWGAQDRLINGSKEPHQNVGSNWFQRGTISPYNAPSDWTRSPVPDPEKAGLSEYAYNEGPTDCPWRINPLTAPVSTLNSCLSAYRTPPMWEAEFNYRKFLAFDRYDGSNNPIWKTTYTISTADPTKHVIEKITPPLSSNLGFPNPFRASFATKRRGTAAVPPDLVYPFAQFPPSRYAYNPRTRTDPFYPSPIATYYPDDLGRFSHLYNSFTRPAITNVTSSADPAFNMEYDNSVFASNGPAMYGVTGRALGACVPRYDYSVRNVLSFSPFDFYDGELRYTCTAKVPTATPPVSPPPIEVYFCQEPASALANPGSSEAPSYGGGRRDLKPDAYWHDATVAMAATVAVAIAAYQPPLPLPTGDAVPQWPTDLSSTGDVKYPPAPTGGDPVLFTGRWGNATRDTDTDLDGFNETAGAFTNVGDLDRLFLLILGEDPDNPGNNLSTRAAMFAVQKGMGKASGTPTPPNNYDLKPFVPTLINLPPYNSAVADYRTNIPGAAISWATQDPYDQAITKLINLRRTSLLNIRKNLYDNEPTYKAEASLLVIGTPPITNPKVLQKNNQLRRCRLRDAERMINDMRMSFFGANLRYQDRNRTGHASNGRFRPLDLDGDGWAICSAYCPSSVNQVQVEVVDKGFTVDDTLANRPANYPMQDPTMPGQKIPYIFSEPTDWTRVVFDDAPDNPNNVALTPGPAQSYWVCFKDVDTAVATNLVTDLTLSDFKDCITYTKTPGDLVNGVDRAGYTRWYYPASRVIAADNAVDGAVTDGVALVPPDTYFSLTGHFVLEKSHFYRLFSRGEVWDEWKKKVVDFSILESVLMLDPDGNVMTNANNTRTTAPWVNAGPLNSSGIEDTSIIFQRWGQDLFKGGKDNAGETR